MKIQEVNRVLTYLSKKTRFPQKVEQIRMASPDDLNSYMILFRDKDGNVTQVETEKEWIERRKEWTPKSKSKPKTQTK